MKAGEMYQEAMFYLCTRIVEKEELGHNLSSKLLKNGYGGIN